MMLTKSEYIEENIKLSIRNTESILKSIEKNLNTIKDITHQIQNSTDYQESMTCFSRIREIALESVIEKTNMFKANLDRFTLPWEDVIVPKVEKYERIRDPITPPQIPITINKRFREKISKNNMPSTFNHSPMDDDDDGDEYYEY